MSAPIPDPTTAAIEQPELSHGLEDGNETATQRFKGGVTAVQTLAASYTIGQTTGSPVTGLLLRSMRIERGVGNTAVLSLDWGKEDQGQGGSKNATALGTNWQLKHTQTNISIYRYCGPSGGASANRGRIEQWRRGTNAYLYANYQWRDKVGAVHTLTARDQLLAAKFAAGKENVMRFYPTIQRVTRYTSGKIAGVGAGLLLLGAPSDAPTGFVPTGWEWMQIGDDLTYDISSGVQTRTTTWLGSEGFDTDFYGATRWDFGSI